MQGLNYSSLRSGDVTFIKIGGSLDAVTAPVLYKKLHGELEMGARSIVCSMKELEHIASAGLGVLISINDELSGMGGEIRLSSLNEKTIRIFKLLGFINLFKLYRLDYDAIESFRLCS